ncbi:DUF883 family protein [Suttonella ornithocola]|uniref:Bacterial protein of uncharacterized function (DUF883) n=1 Tax=Suttonella ornithocola TaxID=279832 RepID=A0A380MY32_9GAMM|nr:DUF883 family protein [Suttonella ornithocola]SUO97188.1 Bacterial protein of uncharacterised function (DUF883) [Suttonella ornithocola]
MTPEQRVEALEKQLEEMRKEFKDARESLKDFAADKWDDAEDLYEDGKGRAHQMLSRAEKQGKKAWRKAKNETCEFVESASDYVKHNPWTVAAVIGGIALIAGIVYRVAESDSERRYFSRFLR